MPQLKGRICPWFGLPSFNSQVNEWPSSKCLWRLIICFQPQLSLPPTSGESQSHGQQQEWEGQELLCALLRRNWNVSQKIKCFKWLSHDSTMNLICDGWGEHRDIPGRCWFLLPISVILHGVDWAPAVPYGSLHQVPDYSLTMCSWETLILWKP